MRITLQIMKSLEENAQSYFEKAKKAKRKAEGARGALERWKIQRDELLVKKTEFEEKLNEEKNKPIVVKKWYHKFRWFFTSDDFLVIGGRDATTNEIVIKKHTQKEDLVFHTDMAGSPFFVIQSGGKVISKKAIQETADATCTFSRAFQLGLSTQSVFYVKPDQVSKEAQSGEYLTKGAFMIRGKTTYAENKINLALGITEEQEVMSGPVDAVTKHCKQWIEIRQGKEKVSSVAKKLEKLLSHNDLDAVIRALPAGSFEIVKQRKL